MTTPPKPVAASPTRSRGLRADAQHNHHEIRAAALALFRSNGLSTPLEEIARLAGVSKGTIYHRFGSRQGLIDDIVEDLVGERMRNVCTAVDALSDPRERFVEFLRQLWMIQYDEPAANDVLVKLLPESRQLVMMCDLTNKFGHQLLCDAQAAGVVRTDITTEDLDQLIWERGIVLRAGPRPTRKDYERRNDYLLHGLLRDASQHDREEGYCD
jgi:AcrR family transcriptional regulator